MRGGGRGERGGKWGVPVLRKPSALSQTSPLSWSVGEGGGGEGREVGHTCLEEAERLVADVAPQLVHGGGGRREGSGAYLS